MSPLYIIILFLLFCVTVLYGYEFYQQGIIPLEYEYYIFMNYSDKNCHLELGKKYHYGSAHIKINYPNALHHYNLAIQNKNYVAYIYIAQLYFDNHNIDLAIDYYNKAIEKGYFQCFIQLGDIYCYESTYSDLDLAEQYYKAAIKYSTFIDAKLEAKDKLKILQNERKDHDFHTKPSQKSVDIDTLMKYNIDVSEEEKPVPGFNVLLNGISSQNFIHREIQKNDRQNVHDHVVSNTVKKSIDNIINYTQIIADKPQTLIQLREHFKKHLMIIQNHR